jgi:DNA-nicking Smr family endonuclease
MRVAMKDKLRKIVFIHGVGQGVLKAEIRRLIKEYYPHCNARDAAWHQYGQGATIVEW